MSKTPPDDEANALVPAATPSTALDAHGFDLTEYDWIPVRRKPRKDGWSHDRQRIFIETLADTGCVSAAAQEVGMSVSSCYRLRRLPGAEQFDAAWTAAMQQASKRLMDIAYERAINGSEEPVFDPQGNRIGRRMRTNDRLLMFLLRAHQPQQYRHANRDGRNVAEALPAPMPVAAALIAMDPVMPDPAQLMSPEELDAELGVADAMAELGGPDPRMPEEARRRREERYQREQAEADARYDALRAQHLPEPVCEDDEDDEEDEDDEQDYDPENPF